MRCFFHSTVRRIMRRYEHKRWLNLRSSFAIALAVVSLVSGGSQARGDDVTLKGSVVCNGACVPDPKKEDHGLVVFAIDGTAEVRATLERIMKDFYPDRGLDAEAAQNLMDQFSSTGAVIPVDLRGAVSSG